ncbi:intradiol ring-cleavage dioxygenase [Aquabacterium sp. UBA2148]|uniref:dioxygenase family protein n=1 Tax=Aquabacterium sp. UBA2148 TaxID=1946042 RepID=UPI00257C0CC1|nr:intradiol ring-cleavage dioxygenase [Aquabacterium sp. UBA2148]
MPQQTAPSADHPLDSLGLQGDLRRMAALEAPDRRRAMTWLAALGGGSLLGATGLSGCGGGGDAATSSSTSGNGTVTATSSSGEVCSVIPTETQGPYPGDGSNSANGSVVNALMLSGIVRSDIRTSVGSASGTAAGVPLTLRVRLVNVNASCATLEGWAIYLWHCTRDGKYSLYSSGVTGENYLRGVQATDSSGTATFTTIFPGCYSGRMPHIHFEVYRSINTATSADNKLLTSQMAFPTEVCESVYDTASGYSASVANLAQVSFASDNVFSDGHDTQMLSITGDVGSGYVATITVGMSV